MKPGKLSYKRKLYFAWQFLRRCPAYIDLYDEYTEFQNERKATEAQFSRRGRNALIKNNSGIEREYRLYFLNYFNIKLNADLTQVPTCLRPPDPKNADPSPQELAQRFERIKCVEQNIFPPDPQDKRFHISVSPFFPNGLIRTGLMDQVRKLREIYGIRSICYQSSEAELKLYLRIYDVHRGYIKSGEFAPWDENNFGLTLYWSKLSRDLSFDGFDADPETLRRTAFKTAVDKVYAAPLSIFP